MLTASAIFNILTGECGYRQGDSILAGVSGGADSVALLHVLHAAKIPVAAAHVNYGLRGQESDDDEQFVSDLCAKLNVPLYTRRASTTQLNELSRNFQEAARLFRYNFLSEVISKESISWKAVAHNSDDQVETVLINFLRGSGLPGLKGMSKRSGHTLRPLLDFSRKEIEEYLQANEVQWRNDSSNERDDYLRNRIRHQVMPVLNELDERGGRGMLHSIGQMAEWSKLTAELALPWWDKISSRRGNAFIIHKQALTESPAPHRLLNYMLYWELRGLNFTEQEFNDLLVQQTGKKYIIGDLQLVVDREEFIITRTGARAMNPFVLSPGTHVAGWSCTEITAAHPEKFTGFEAILQCDRPVEFEVRSWAEGDKIRPLGFDGTRKISDVLTEMKIPAHEKEQYPVLTCNDEIAWVPGYRIAEKFRVTDPGKTALHIKWHR